MSEPYATPNEVQGTLTSDYVHGTDAHLHLVAIGLFATGGGFIRVYTTDKAHWALLEYTGISTNDLTGLTQANLTGLLHTDAAYTFPAASIVERAQMGEDVSKRIMGPASATDGTFMVFDGTSGKKAKDAAGKLGGNMDVNGNSIVSASNGNIPITPNGTGNTIITALCYIKTEKTGAATLTVAESGVVLVSNAGASYELELPTAAGHTGLWYHFIKTDANYNPIVLNANGTETFNYENATGAPTLTYPRLNTYCAEVTVVSNGTNWQVVAEQLGQIPQCRVYLFAGPTDLTSGAYTLMHLDTESYDIGSNFDAATTHKFTTPIAGRYLITASITWFGISVIADKRYGAFVDLNSAANYIATCNYHASFAGYITTPVYCMYDLAIGDTLEFYAKQESGANTVDITGGVGETHMAVRLLQKT